MKRSKLGLILLGLVGWAAAEGLLAHHYYSQTYRYYEAGEVYWEDSKTLLLLSPDRYLFWRLKPRLRMHLAETPEEYGLRFVGGRPRPYRFTIQTDSHGYRSPEFDCEAGGDRVRIVTLGDSRTMAEGVEYTELYGLLLQRRLQAATGRRHELVNPAVSGYSSYQGVVQLEREILPCRPDLVTVLFGVNDRDRDEALSDRDKATRFDTPSVTLRAWANRSLVIHALRSGAWWLRGRLLGRTRLEPPDPPAGAPPRVSLAEYDANLRRLAALARLQRFQLVLLILPNSPYAFSADLHPEPPLEPAEREALRRARRKAPALPGVALAELELVLARVPDWSEAHFLRAQCLQRLGRWEEARAAFMAAQAGIELARYESVVRRVAADTGTLLVDLSADVAGAEEILFVDDMHPNAAGHALIARRLAEGLERADPGFALTGRRARFRPASRPGSARIKQ